MSDDWSLKDNIESGMYGQDCIYMKNLETLRQKLIEILKLDVEVYNQDYLIKVAIERDINKLFGVKE